ncbi:MAG: FtsX-like permease family protein [Candidatus Lokiarchaeota archaeon]|nr:FtsX-like permease family protein [Candidatus Lokiarchaeota archaeon]
MTKQPKMLKGNRWWSLGYALSSLKNYPVRNAGIAIILAIGIALPTTVFIWSDTGTRIVIEDYFDEVAFQYVAYPAGHNSYFTADMPQVQEYTESVNVLEHSSRVGTTIGILTGEELPDYSSYAITNTNYLAGLKDMRVIVAENDFIDIWSREFITEGNFSDLSVDEILVSEQFCEYTRQVHGLTIEVGSKISLDVIKRIPGAGEVWSKTQLNVRSLGNLTVVGVYTPKSLSSIAAQVFPNIMRRNWDPFGFPDPVLGLSDSVIINEDALPEGDMNELVVHGFGGYLFMRASISTLITMGTDRLVTNLESFQESLQEQFPDVDCDGLGAIWELENTINTFIASRVLSVIVFPIMIMSLMLTLFTSETSVSRRKVEISALRAKGASFNQVFSTFMYESLFLCIIGFVIALGLSVIMAPLIGSSTGLFVFDVSLYMTFSSNLTISPVALVIAGAIAMYLPSAYLLHVARRIDVSEVGQPAGVDAEEGAEDISAWKYTGGLALLLASLVIIPEIIAPLGVFALLEILIATLVLFAAAYLGSRAMRLITARVSRGTSFVLGEKSLYMAQSLRKRKGQFIPLLVILTLTLTTTTMMLIQVSTFETTLQNELDYSLGADIRIETASKPFSFNETLLHYPGVIEATPLVETWATVGSQMLFMESVDPLAYLRVAHFKEDSFVSGTPEEVLQALDDNKYGIVISEYHAINWNKTIGQTVAVYYGSFDDEESRYFHFEIVGLLKSAPGFGIAATEELVAPSFGSQFGFQAGAGGFVLTNLEFISESAGFVEAETFLADVSCFSDITPLINTLELERNTKVYTPQTFDIKSESYSIQLFLSGIQGLTVVSFIMCAIMGLASIALFLGSAVLERKSEYALFRSLGGTKGQVVSMVFGEFSGIVIAAIAISAILGLVFGYVMAILTLGVSPFSPILGEVLSFPLSMMIVTLSLESFVMIASCYIPARRAGQVNPATALRNL